MSRVDLMPSHSSMVFDPFAGAPHVQKRSHVDLENEAMDSSQHSSPPSPQCRRPLLAHVKRHRGDQDTVGEPEEQDQKASRVRFQPVNTEPFLEHALQASHSKRVSLGGQSRSSSSSASPRADGNQPLYTHAQLSAVVKCALEKQQLELRAQYEKTLNDLLAEQFNAFTEFNASHISRSFRMAPDCSYLS